MYIFSSFFCKLNSLLLFHILEQYVKNSPQSDLTHCILNSVDGKTKNKAKLNKTKRKFVVYLFNFNIYFLDFIE